MAHVNSGMEECCGAAKSCLAQCSKMPVLHCILPGNVLAIVTALQSPWNTVHAYKHTALQIFESHLDAFRLGTKYSGSQRVLLYYKVLQLCSLWGFWNKALLYSYIFIFKYTRIIINKPVLDATLAEFFWCMNLLLFDWYWYSSFGIRFTSTLYKCSNYLLFLFALQYWYLFLAVVPFHIVIITFTIR